MPSTKKPSTKATAKKLLESATDPGEPSLTESGRRLIADIEQQWELNSVPLVLFSSWLLTLFPLQKEQVPLLKLSSPSTSTGSVLRVHVPKLAF